MNRPGSPTVVRSQDLGAAEESDSHHSRTHTDPRPFGHFLFVQSREDGGRQEVHLFVCRGDRQHGAEVSMLHPFHESSRGQPVCSKLLCEHSRLLHESLRSPALKSSTRPTHAHTSSAVGITSNSAAEHAPRFSRRCIFCFHWIPVERADLPRTDSLDVHQLWGSDRVIRSIMFSAAIVAESPEVTVSPPDSISRHR